MSLGPASTLVDIRVGTFRSTPRHRQAARRAEKLQRVWNEPRIARKRTLRGPATRTLLLLQIYFPQKIHCLWKHHSNVLRCSIQEHMVLGTACSSYDLRIILALMVDSHNPAFRALANVMYKPKNHTLVERRQSLRCPTFSKEIPLCPTVDPAHRSQIWPRTDIEGDHF